MRNKGKDLIFISKICRNGLSVDVINSQSDYNYLKDTEFNLFCLSLTEKTYIAHGFNSFIVKLKKPLI